MRGKMSAKKTKKPYRPKKYATKLVKSSEVSFNLAQQVHNYGVIKRLMGLFEQTVDENGQQLYSDSVAFFHGKACSYDDWFEALEIDEDKFYKVYSKLNKQKMKGDADAMYARIVEKKMEEDKKRVVLASDVNPQTFQAAKEIFNKQLSSVKGG